ncbi:anthranilate synthase component I family protein [Lactobacillus sp. Sy-1]|uniref:anthranilate synthase component I family protein n=1 Tax=Lactobacillus sp. Sy-1 TaxID=2109645 RepID=UPI001C5AD003|nr:anthranilate synthase component I family protein [Lactobacillus sp. Sy-1]MBW1606300.1 anthranilate synthase component I family protein [Lactobacillus sp. Sy-1]
MNIKSELKQLSHDYNYLPVSASVQLNQFDPFQIINHDEPDANHSMMFEYQDSRYTAVVIKPLQVITARNGNVQTTDQSGQTTEQTTSPITFLNQLIHKYQVPKLSLPPFSTGLIGYFGYDFAKYDQNNRLTDTPDDLDLADLELMIPDITLTYDRQNHQLTASQLIASEHLNTEYEATIQRLEDRLNEVITILSQQKPKLPGLKINGKFKNQFNLAQFDERVAQTKHHIELGDIFQLILSNPYQASAQGSLINVGKTLFEDVKSPYHFYFANNDFQSVGASPETLISKSNAHLFSYPLAGTRRRGHDQVEDEKFAAELTHSPKELAEHNMLVDLGRNDLGRVSEFGSVHVTKLRELLRFSNVMHLGSKIKSVANKEFTPVDIVSAVLPAGTLSGAPKESAMKIIAKLEQRKRGIYGGGIGYIDFNGDLDLCIGIRLGYKKGDHLVIHSGAGIVADSDANQEFHEFGNKSRLMLDAIKAEQAQEENQYDLTN